MEVGLAAELSRPHRRSWGCEVPRVASPTPFGLVGSRFAVAVCWCWSRDRGDDSCSRLQAFMLLFIIAFDCSDSVLLLSDRVVLPVGHGVCL